MPSEFVQGCECMMIKRETEVLNISEFCVDDLREVLGKLGHSQVALL